MKYSTLVERVAGEGADAWNTHYAASAAKERGEDVVILSIGDPDIDTPRPVVDRAIECLESGDTHYTPIAGRERLREAIAQRHRERSGQNAEAANVMFCSGAQNALFSASMCLAGPGDEVIALEPLYPTYPATLQVTGARMVRVRAPAESGFRVDLAGLESAISPRTRAIFFATPNNPSGVIVHEEELAVIGELARRHSLWVVTDEVYAGLAPGGRVPSLAARLPEQTVTVASLSKTHAMPGWRAGWMVGPKELIEHVEGLGLAMLYGLPGFIQEAALTAVGMAAKAEQQTRDFCARRRDFVLAALAGVPQIRCLAPEAGMFMLIDVRGCGLSGHEFMSELYREERVSILDGGAFGRDTADFVRLCFATDEATLREACVRIRRFAQRRH
ncbi:MAG TPA: aminotransferase class I/II-fold pyridoxal phosphate-dependent enzyme [Steroidobacteraceae bacterium]|nr:aminotransferase class I/II-fold pyridoxal phosphate-dependent enzyme [Steroidobacteraceae bacterium]